MVKHIQTICRQEPTNLLSVFDHFVGLALKGLIELIIVIVIFGEVVNHDGDDFNLDFKWTFVYRVLISYSSLDLQKDLFKTKLAVWRNRYIKDFPITGNKTYIFCKILTCTQVTKTCSSVFFIYSKTSPLVLALTVVIHRPHTYTEFDYFPL